MRTNLPGPILALSLNKTATTTEWRYTELLDNLEVDQ